MFSGANTYDIAPRNIDIRNESNLSHSPLLSEQLHNQNINSIEFDGFRNQAGLHSFSLTPKEWVQKTNAVGLYAKAGRYGET